MSINEALPTVIGNGHVNGGPMPWKLLEGERIVNPEADQTETILTLQNERIKGKLFITNFRLYFRSDEHRIPVNTTIKSIANSPIVSMSSVSTITTEFNKIGIDKMAESSTSINGGGGGSSSIDSNHVNSSNSNGSISTNNSNESKSAQQKHDYLIVDVPLGLIQRIEKLNSNSTFEFIGIMISCKNGRRLKFLKIANDQTFEKSIYETLVKYSFPLSNNLNFFAFEFKSVFKFNDGWAVYDAEREYTRMGIFHSNKWQLTRVNENYEFCDTYPRVLAVPSTSSDLELRKVAEFRSKNRIPVLCWIKANYPEDINIQHEVVQPQNQPVILRSSQPLCGLSGKRNNYDETYLTKIADMNDIKQLEIMDARPYINALANCTYGGGFENSKYYIRCPITFLNIENIHTMRDSLGTNSDKDFFVSLENSKWLEHIKMILEGALKIVDCIDINGSSVLVHCSDGWDRTPQLTSLAMLMLDKYYRTIQGFEVLIEKEWLSFGHRFELRMGHGTSKYSDQDRSPIFLQFIDCVWQIMQQHPKFFEFNEKLLLVILENMYTCQFGTFLYNSEHERHKNDVRSKTASLWSFVNSNLDEFYNSDYLENQITIKYSPQMPLKLWTNYYFLYKDSSESLQIDTLQKGVDSVTNLFENFAPNSFNFLSNTGYRLFNQFKANLKS